MTEVCCSTMKYEILSAEGMNEIIRKYPMGFSDYYDFIGELQMLQGFAPSIKEGGYDKVRIKYGDFSGRIDLKRDQPLISIFAEAGMPFPE